ncbi:MAG: PTS ascorbate transporter subunit IIC [Mycoplasmatales bacterium]
MSNFLSGWIDFASQPSILIGIVVFVGLLLQKKNFSDIVAPTLKAIVGFLVVGAAAGIIVDALDPFGKMIEAGFGLKGVIPNNEAIVAIGLKDYGQATAFIMTLGMIFNILLARITKYKYIFLTGHHTLFMACMISVILIESGQSGVMLYVNGGLTLGLLMVITPALCQPFMRKITGNDSIAMGHFSGMGYALSGTIGKLFGKKGQSTEEIKVPKNVSFLRDSTVAISITMVVLYLIVALFAGADYIQTELSDGQNFLVYSFIKALTFSAGFIVIQTGVRMMLAEIVPAFKGISEKLVPNAIPALDVPVIFPTAPNAVIIGFICSFIGGLISMLVLGFLQWTIIIPGVVPHFFTGAAAGIFGNATGGKRGAIVGAFSNGVLISFLPVFLLPVLGGFGFEGSTFSDADFGVVGIILGNLVKFGGTYIVLGFLLVVASVLLILSRKAIKKN